MSGDIVTVIAVLESGEIRLFERCAEQDIVDPRGSVGIWEVKAAPSRVVALIAVRRGGAVEVRRMRDEVLELLAVHILWHGRPLCDGPGLEGVPATWPPGHRWVNATQAKLATCAACIDRRVDDN